jgi:hypothetical protein
MPKIKNYTFPEGNYRTPDGMIGALQAERSIGILQLQSF